MFPTRFPHTRETPTSSSSSSSLFEASKTVSTVSVARISTASDPRHFATGNKGDARVKFARKQEGHLATSPFSLPRTGSGSRRKEIAGNDQTRNGNSEASKRKGGREDRSRGLLLVETRCVGRGKKCSNTEFLYIDRCQLLQKLTGCEYLFRAEGRGVKSIFGFLSIRISFGRM